MEPTPECFEMIDGGEHNPYHFLFYMLSNFLITDVNKQLIYYYPNKKDCKVSEGFLQLLPPNFIRHTTKQTGIVYKPFISTIPIFEDVALPQSYHLVRHLFKNCMAPELKKGKSIYIQRKPGETRTFINEKDLQRSLESNGYETIILENYEIKEQIRIVSEAEYIIGAHGAGLAFTVFCNQHAKVIEICGKNNNVSKHYYHIAHMLGHHIFRFQDVIINEDDNTLVNIKELDAFLKLWHCSQLM
jgi:capsular polysaccharide biosynthesis protein